MWRQYDTAKIKKKREKYGKKNYFSACSYNSHG